MGEVVRWVHDGHDGAKMGDRGWNLRIKMQDSRGERERRNEERGMGPV